MEPRDISTDADLGTLREDVDPPDDATHSATPSSQPSHPSHGARHAVPLPEPELPPELTARFEILSTLGRGGMGIVYLGRDRRLERQVALKLMLSTSRSMTERFESEGKVLAALEHDHVVRLYDYGTAGTMPYLVMEYVRGQTLSARLAAGRPTVIESVRIACEMLEGVLAAHRQGIVHRDLKPANVFLEESGRAKVADFGVARRRAGRGDGGAGEICGTPGYMAPEQAAGRASGTAADIYAVGVMLHQMLTGQRLWTGNSLTEILETQLSNRPVPPSQVNPSVPAQLSDLVERALEVEPEKRPSGEELLAQLAGWRDRARRLSREPGSAGFPPAPYKRLEHFGPDDAVIFFGRHAETMELVDALGSAVRLLAVFGPCGIGKSSLVHAGLVPALARAGHDVIPVVSGPDPAHALREAIAARALAQRLRLPSGEPISASALALAPDLIVYALVELARATKKTQVIVLDQLEEVFTQNASDSPAIGSVFDTIVRIVESQVESVRFALSYRSEFHASFFPLEERLARYRRAVLVRQISEEGLVEAIEGPTSIEFYGFRYEDGLPHRIAREILAAATDQGSTPLPVMQIICSQLHERMRARGADTIAARDYEELGGVEGALSRYVEDKLAGPEYAHGAGIARQMLKSLTIKEEGKERFSRARDEEEVLAFPDHAAARATLERLVTDHLVVRQVRGERRSVRLASEVICQLVDGWELEPDATERAYRVLTKNQRQWAESGRREEELLSGGGLALVEQHLGAMKDVTPDERAFVAASQAARRQRRIERFLALSVAAALVLFMAWMSFLRPGLLKMSSEPQGAEIWQDGAKLGVTPLEWRARPGVYRFTLKRDRHEDVEEVVQVSAGGTAVTTPVLPHRYGLLQVSSAPLGARCEVRRAGAPALVAAAATPFTTEVLPGRYELAFSHPGYLGKTVGPVEVRGNHEFTQESIPLKRNAGALQVGSPFPGVDMDLIDPATGRVVWESALPLRRPQELPVGRYLMRATRAGSVSYEHPVDVTLGTTTAFTAWVPPVAVTWKARIGASTSPPALGHFDGDGTLDVVVGSEEGAVRALSGRTGHELWRHDAGDEVASGPGVGDLDGDGAADVVVGTAARALVALAGRTGKPLWTYATDAPVESSPALVDLDRDGTPDVIAGAKDGRVHAVSGRTGKAIWIYETTGGVRASAAIGDLDRDGVPDAVVGSKDRHLHAISGRTGDDLWRFRTEGWVASPALADLDGDAVPDAVFGSADNRVYAVSGKDGHKLWQFETGSIVSWAPALADLTADGVPDAIVGSTDRFVYALDGKSGHVLWKRETGGAVRASPMVADLDGDGVKDAALGSTDGHVWVLSGRNGSTIWTFATRGWVSTPALGDLIGDGTPDVIVSSGDGHLYVLSSRPGSTVWAFDARGAVRAPPLQVDADGDGTAGCVIASDDGRVRAISGASGLRLWSYHTAARVSGDLASVRAGGEVRVLVPLADGALVALSAPSGAVAWTHAGRGQSGTPAVLAGDSPRVAVARGAALDVLDAGSGKRVAGWTSAVALTHLTAVPGSGRAGAPRMLAATRDGNLIALDADCRVLWTWKRGGALARPGVGELDGAGEPEVVIGTEDRHVVALELATGRERWSADTGAPVGGTPSFTDLDRDGKDDVVIGSSYRDVHALSGLTGRQLWSADTGGPLADAPLLVDADGDGTEDAVLAAADRRVHVLSGRNGARLSILELGHQPEGGPALVGVPSAADPYVKLIAVHERSLVMLTRLRWPVKSVAPQWFTMSRDAANP